MTNKKGKRKDKKVFLFGIDGASPELLFDKWKNDLPNIKRLMDKGSYAKLNSCIPPSTIIAWNSMISGKDASEIGVFNYTYKDKENKSQLVNSNKIKTNLIWDILGKQGKKSISLYVPLTYPVKPINGKMVSGFLTPNLKGKCTYPESLKEKIKLMKNPELFFDVGVGLAGHKGLELDELIKKTYEMTDMQIKLLKDLIKEDWDFFIGVIIGTDRLQHMLWRHFDNTHKKFIKDSPYKDALKNYYTYLDKKLGEILELLDENVTIIVASDHGMIKQEGKININNWLIEQGYLVLKEGVDITQKKRFNNDFIDMEKTTAYGGGAYNARIYINKEKLGENYEVIREEIIEKLKNIPDDKGNKLNTQVFKAEEVYTLPDSADCPDLTVYFDDLKWASNPDLGQKGLYSWESAIGADSAGHSKQGCFIINGKEIENKGFIGEIDIKKVVPVILKLLDVEIPADIKSKPLEVIKNRFYEAGLIDSTDEIQLKVYANSHPNGFVIAKPKYIPSNIIDFVGFKKRFISEKCMTRFNLFKEKEIVEENLNRLKEKFPEYIYYCTKHKNWFLGVPETKIKKIYDSKQGLKELMKVPAEDLDDYLISCRKLVEYISKSGIKIEDIGISHSTLLGNYTPGKSDIDIIIFGKENGWKAINFLETAQHPLLKWKTREEWAQYYKDRIISNFFTEEEYIANMIRKKDDGLFNEHVFSIFIVEKEDEGWYDWSEQHEPLATVKLTGTVADNYNSIVRPGFYEIKDSKIIEGYEDVPVKRIITWSRPFVLQAKKEEKIEACGLLEKIKSKGEEFYQVVIGYFDTYIKDRGQKEYIKALIK